MSSSSSEVSFIVDALMAGKSVVVKASAGAGKTTLLVNVVSELSKKFYTKNLRYPRLLLSTFTLKAAAEIQQRLLGQVLNQNKDPFDPWVQHVIRENSIVTIDALLLEMIRKWGAVIGLGPDLNVEEQEKKFFDEFIKHYRLIDASFNQWIQDYLFYYGWSDILEAFKDLIRKTFTTQKMEFLDYETWLILVNDRLEKLLDRWKNIQTHSDVKQWANSKWLDRMQEFHVIASSKIKDPFEISRIHEEMFKNVRRFKKGYQNALDSIDPQFFEDWKDYFNWLKTVSKKKDFLPTVFELNEKLKNVWPNLFENFLDFIRKKNAVSLGFLDVICQKIFQELPDNLSLAKFDYAFFDEYQDTSEIQHVLLKRIFKDCPIFIVGDPRQSIYLFRGADQTLFESIVNDPHITLIDRSVNYRCGQAVVNFVNHVFNATTARLNGSSFGHMQPCAQERGIVSVWQLECESDNPNWPLHVMLAIQEWQRQLGFSWADCAVLATKHDVLDKISQQATQMGIGIIKTGTSRFLQFLHLFDILMDFRDNWFERDPFADFSTGWLSLENESFLNLIKTDRIQEKNSVPKPHGPILPQWIQALSKKPDFSWYWQIDPSGQIWAATWWLIGEIWKQSLPEKVSLSDLWWKIWLNFKHDELIPPINPISMSESMKLMTIHSSKGLEFDWVVLPFWGLREKSDWSCFQIETSKLNTQITVRLPELAAYPVQKNQPSISESEMEWIRLFYVAMTRAKKGLLVVLPKKPDQSDLTESKSPLKVMLSVIYELSQPFQQRPDLEDSEKDEKSEMPRLFKLERWLAFKSQASVEARSGLESSGDKYPISMGDDRFKLRDSRLPQMRHGSERHRSWYHAFLKQPDLWQGLWEDLLTAKGWLYPPEKIFWEWQLSWQDSQARVWTIRPDVWGLSQDFLWVIDFKSAFELSPHELQIYKNQVYRYGWVLKEFLTTQRRCIQTVALALMNPDRKILFWSEQFNPKDLDEKIRQL